MTEYTRNHNLKRILTMGLAVLMVFSLLVPLITDPSYAAFTGKKGSKYTVWDGGQITYGSGNGGYSNSRKCDLDDDLGTRYSYCVQPSKASPGTGTVTVDKVITDDNDTGKWNALRNVVYYSPSYPGYDNNVKNVKETYYTGNFSKDWGIAHIKTHGREERLTNAAVLLFAKNVYQFYPNCRIRFLRYDGNYAQVGTSINLIRDTGIECSLLEIIDKAKDFIATQLREFTLLDEKTGKFQVVPEYPEFAWQEGIVNAVVHREYAMTGSYIKVTMYDDRLEIESPGKLPNIVTVENIRETRFSRNPRISRVLTEMGWVRELNEGVKRIYSDMESFFLEAPIYSDPEQSVRLVLKNNIIMRSIRQGDRAMNRFGQDVWDSLDNAEKMIVSYLINKGAAKRAELTQYTGKSSGTVTNRLNKLIDRGLVKANGNQYDPNRNYEVVLP